MEQFLILLMLAGVTHAFISVPETKCNATQATSICSVIVGGPVYIQVMANASGHQLRCWKDVPGATNVFSLKKGKVTIQEPFRNRMQFFINNGTLKITNVERNNSGQYNVEVYDPNGFLVKNIHFKLDVKENIFGILIQVSVALGAVVIVVTCCFVCRRAKHRKKSGSSV